MASKKEQIFVNLVADIGKDEPMKGVYTVAHAEKILRMPGNGGWKLPADSKFNFNEKDGITRKTSGGSSSQQ